MQTFTTTIDGDLVQIRLYSLDEYEAEGGCYDDSGNGGDVIERDEFIAAATVNPANDTGLPENDILEAAGLPQSSYWLDSVTGYFLLRDWPADAPLAARMVMP